MRTRARARNHASGSQNRGRAAVRGRDEADKWGLPVSVSQRGEEGEPDERDPLVSDRLRKEARAVPVWAERERAGLRAGFQAARCAVAFPFS